MQLSQDLLLTIFHYSCKKDVDWLIFFHVCKDWNWIIEAMIRTEKPYRRFLFSTLNVGDIEIFSGGLIQWFAEQEIPFNYILVNKICQYGEFESVKWLYEIKFFFNGTYRVVQSGNLTTLQWLCAKGEKITMNMVIEAMTRGFIDMVKWMVEQNCPLHYSLTDLAAERGDLELLQWFIEKRCPTSKYLLNYGLFSGNIEMVKWIISFNFYPLSRNANNAAASGNLELVQWLNEMRFEFTGEAIYMAIAKGHLHIAKWLFASGFRYQDGEAREENELDILSVAASRGDLDSIKWLYDLGYRSDVVFETIVEWNIEVIEWLIDHEFVITDESMTHAIHDENLNALKILTNNKPEICIELLRYASYIGNLDILKYLLEHCDNYPKHLMNWVILEGKLNIAIWLDNMGQTFTEEAVESARQAGHVEMVEWCEYTMARRNK